MVTREQCIHNDASGLGRAYIGSGESHNLAMSNPVGLWIQHRSLYDFFLGQGSFRSGFPTLAASTCAYWYLRNTLVSHSMLLPSTISAWVPDAQQGILLWHAGTLRYLRKSNDTVHTFHWEGAPDRLFGHRGQLSESFLSFDPDVVSPVKRGLERLLFKWLYPEAVFQPSDSLKLNKPCTILKKTTRFPHYVDTIFFPLINAANSLNLKVQCTKNEVVDDPEKWTYQGQLSLVCC